MLGWGLCSLTDPTQPFEGVVRSWLLVLCRFFALWSVSCEPNPEECVALCRSMISSIVVRSWACLPSQPFSAKGPGARCFQQCLCGRTTKGLVHSVMKDASARALDNCVLCLWWVYTRLIWLLELSEWWPCAPVSIQPFLIYTAVESHTF
jgi:hypothetical protein